MTRKNFNELAAAVRTDPDRAARIDALKAEAVAEHNAFTLNQLREQLGLTQAQVAEMLGVTQGAVSLGFRHASTLEQIKIYLEAMGYDIEVHAVRGDERVLLDI
jgi:predicted XRE-type DNA-binding protein